MRGALATVSIPGSTSPTATPDSLVSGPDAAAVLNAGCPLPLGLAAFPGGKCTRTLFGKAEIVLWRKEETAFRIEVWRSFAAYLADLMAEAAREHQV